MAKTVLPSKFTEAQGLNRISEICREMNCLFRVISQDDVGIDGEIEVVKPKSDGSGFEVAGGIIKVQAKSGSSYVKKDKSDGFATPVKLDDLVYWKDCTFPVFFIVYHPEDDQLFFKEIKTYVRETTDVFNKPYEVVFDKNTDQFVSEAKQQVYEQSEISPPRISFEDRERFFSNLLPVTKLPKKISFAKTRRNSRKRIKDDIEGYSPPFCVYEKRLYTLSDLHHEQNVLRDYCDVESIGEVSVDDWMDDHDDRRQLVFLLNQLFGSHCYRCGLAYNPDFRRTYFPRESDDDSETKFERRWKSPRSEKAKEQTRAVVQFYEYGDFKFWRHLAAEFSFVNFGAKWFLQISPKYLFTNDGKKPVNPKLVGPYTTRLKAMQHNLQVMNHVLFWGQALADGKHRIEMNLFGEPIVTIAKEPISTVANFAIPIDPATYEEKAPTNQMKLFGWNMEEEEIDY